MKRRGLTFLWLLIILQMMAVTSYAWEQQGNWETVIYLDNQEIITRVSVDDDNEIAVKLKEFAEAIGYSVQWVGGDQSIILQNETEKIILYVNQYKGEKNGREINLSKPVFIDGDSAYLPQSVLRAVFDIDTIAIDREREYSRVNGVFLANLKEFTYEIKVVHSNNFHLEVTPKDTEKDGETLLLSFALGIEKEGEAISMDYEQFLISNDRKIAGTVKEEFEKITSLNLKTVDGMADVKVNTVNAINKALDTDFVKYIYITEFTWYTP